MDNLTQLKAKIFAKQKILAKIYSRDGAQSLSDYVSGWAVSVPSESTRAFFGQVQRLLLRTFPADLADGVIKQAGQRPLCSTIDHHGILNHPFFINSNLIYSQRRELKYLPCLSTAGVSLNNSSWPGCLLLSRPDGRTERLSFFRDKIKTQAVFAAKGLGLKDVEKVQSQIQTAGFLTEDNKRRLLDLVEEIFQNENFYKFANFSAQASYASAALWAKVFPAAPKLVYLPLEELISAVIADEIAPNKDHILYKLFFTVLGWDSIEKYFQGSLGAFSSSHKGSFLFWGVSGKVRRIHLARRKDQLANGDFVIPANVEAIVNNLQTGKLYPTSLVCFLVLLYYGITCLGGFNQVNWLTNIKENFVDLLAEWGERELAARVLAVPTENFAEGSLAFGLNQQGQIYKPTILDLYLQNDQGIYEKYRQLVSKITLKESIDAALPEIYKVIILAKDRENKLLDITENDILNYSGLADKIKSVLGV